MEDGCLISNFMLHTYIEIVLMDYIESSNSCQFSAYSEIPKLDCSMPFSCYSELYFK